jgi:hypothetical protein
MKVFLDDERDNKMLQARLAELGIVEDTSTWTRCYWPEEVIELLKTGNVEVLALDHDLGDSAARFQNRPERTGMTVINWLEEQVHTKGFKPPEVIHCHSMNPDKRREMRYVARQIKLKWRELSRQ